MPKAFSEKQRENIRELLLAVGKTHFERFGYRRTNVAEIARAAGIAKGTFYLFFDAKAALFGVLAAEAERRFRQNLLSEMGALPTPEEQVAVFVRAHAAGPPEEFLRLLLDPEESAAVFRDLPQEVSQGLQKADDGFCAEVLEQWRRQGLSVEVSAPVLTGVLRGLFALHLRRDLLGAEHFDDVLEFMVEGLVARLLTGTGAALEGSPS